MVLSMTGFGAAEGHHEGVGYRVEIRSVNSRYFKLTLKLPEHLASLDTRLEAQLRERLARGSVTFTLSSRDDDAAAAVDVNVATLRLLCERLASIGDLGGRARIDLAALLALPGIVRTRELDDDLRQRIFAFVEGMTGEAIEHLLEMRRTEGSALRDDLLSHTQAMRATCAAVKERAPLVVAEYQERLRTRVRQLLATNEIALDQDDLLREVAVFAERCDISEELSRLASHLDHFEALCDGAESAGRKLDFISQEMLREANTIGSKANDAVIARHVVELKTRIDRIKEQVQNVE